MSAALKHQAKKKKKHGLKVAMVGDPQIGKTSLMVKYVEVCQSTIVQRLLLVCTQDEGRTFCNTPTRPAG